MRKKIVMPLLALTAALAFSREADLSRAINAYLDSLGNEKAIAEIFLVNIEGNTVFSPVEKLSDLTENPADSGSPLVSGGILFFSYNLSETPEGIISFTKSIRDYCSQNGTSIPYIAIDQEGGEVNRLREATSYLPSPARVASSLSANQAHELYKTQARQMKSLGFSMNLAPVFESVSDHNKEFLSLRSFGKEAKSTAYSLAAVSAYEENGVGAVLKHFPGNTNADPHTLLPEISLSKNALYGEVILPLALILNASPSAVLMSHARTRAIDPETPACLSKIWTTEILRGKLGFTNLVVSDDLFMAALAKNGYPPEKACILALEAGTDVIMLSEKRFAPVAKVLLKKAQSDKTFAKRLREAECHVVAFKVAKGILTLKNDESDENKLTLTPAPLPSNSERLKEYKAAFTDGVSVYQKYFSR